MPLTGSNFGIQFPLYITRSLSLSLSLSYIAIHIHKLLKIVFNPHLPVSLFSLSLSLCSMSLFLCMLIASQKSNTSVSFSLSFSLFLLISFSAYSQIICSNARRIKCLSFHRSSIKCLEQVQSLEYSFRYT